IYSLLQDRCQEDRLPLVQIPGEESRFVASEFWPVVLAAEGEAKLADDFQVGLVQMASALEGGHEAPYVFAEIYVVVIDSVKCSLFEHQESLGAKICHQAVKFPEGTHY